MREAKKPTPSGSFDEGRFPPGTLLAERYRIVGLLGQGGMGEVYRANDLKLGQPVALKFLFAATKNQQLLARFQAEVRIARQVSHPNVCRVYDIGEADGCTFLSMEYVDGEDLRSLLRRIGRLPGDKAVEIARKLCAGLAAAHDKGVLHRDLKPANVMIDGRGQVLIADFGLAALTGQLEGAQLLDGTPAYMAPEQLAGTEVSVRSDIYALGLVLHEMFTGRRAFENGSGRTTPTALSSHTKDIDPLVERVILRCLDVEPRNRPVSALAVAAALPGGDPLAAALAAGDTPTPGMVAASGDTEGISLRTAAFCLAWILAGLAALLALSPGTNLLLQTPVPNSSEILAHKAREMIARFGYAVPPADSACEFSYDNTYATWAEKQMKPAAFRDRLAKGQPPLIFFWYRQSPQTLAPISRVGMVSATDPPPLVSGMIGLSLDPQGRLLQLDAIPPQLRANAAPSPSFDWKTLFRAADLDMSRFTAAEPQWISLAPFDARAAWTGSYPGAPGIPLRVEAASWRGTPVLFRIVGPWSIPDRMQQPPGIPAGPFIVIQVVLAVSALLAWRNFRSKRGDIRGANRTAAFIFCAGLLGLALNAHHADAASDGLVASALLPSFMIWAVYLALEPYVRRRWPQSMISWSRVLSGGFRDPLVGGHLLFGIAAGIGLALVHSGSLLWPAQNVVASSYSLSEDLHFLDMRGLAGGLLIGLIRRLGSGMLLTFVLMMLRVLLRREWLAAAALILLWGSFGIGSAHNLMGAVPAMLFAALFAAILLRFGGLLPTIVSFYVGNELTTSLAADFSSWYANTTIALMVIILALTAYAFHTAVAGRPLFRAGFLDPD